MSDLPLGMRYSDVAKRIKRIAKSPMHSKAKLNLIGSLANQCRLAEGEKSLSELDAEVSANNNRSLAFSGAGNKQTGICMKFDCIYRNIRRVDRRKKENRIMPFCDKCIRFSYYKTFEDITKVE